MDHTRNQAIESRQQKNPERVNERPTVAPRVDVFENEKELLVIADLPGIPKEALSLHVEKDTLVLEGRRPERKTKGSSLAAEYRSYDFRRTFALPPGLDLDKIDARLEKGVLTLTLPKQAALQPRRIAVRTN
jgi:HSP20 family molecular chaperone IbpA